ncbi:MAG: prealbumin-like fold domain-containing protein [Candidatus Limnocylindria bacterium]
MASSITLLLSSVYLVAAPVLATQPDPAGNNGTVKIHEGASEDEPIVANEPQVCTFHLHFFFGDDVQSGDWWIKSWPPTGDGTVVLAGSYDATGGEDRQPETGTYSLPDGHYKLFWEGATNPGEQLNIKHKVFWVTCGEDEGEATPTPTPTATPTPKPTKTPRPEGDNAALNIRKLDEQGNRLPGAVFTVEGMSGTFTTNARGFFCITGLPNDSHWLVTEIQAPEGYEIAGEASQLVEVDDDGDCNSPDAVFVNKLADEGGETPTPTPSATPTPTATPSEGEEGGNPTPTPAPTTTPREGEEGGNPTPTPGALPDTALTAGSGSTTSTLVALLALLSLGVLGGAQVVEVRSRR